MKRFKERAWWCWNLVVRWFYTIDHWLNVVLYPIEQAVAWLAVRAWDLRSLLIGAGGVVVAVAGLYNTSLLSGDPAYSPGLLAGLAFIQFICLGLGVFGLYLRFLDDHDSDLGIRASTFAAYMGYYIKTLFAGIVTIWAGTAETMQTLLARANMLLY